jgi:hypothetical protein
MPATLESFENASPPSQFTNFRTELESIKRKKTEMDTYVDGGLTSDMANLQSTFSLYVKSCGVNSAMAGPNDRATQTVADKARIITDKLNDYSNTVVKPLAALRRNILREINVNAKTDEISRAFEENARLEKEVEKATNELSTATLRDNLVQTKDDAISFEQTWGYLRRPLRRVSIPILIVFSLLFLTAALFGLYYIGISGLGNSSFSENGIFHQLAAQPVLFIAPIIVTVIVVVLKLMKQI